MQRACARRIVEVEHQVEDIDRKFRAAWKVFAETCVNTLVPEATYQAWFAHYLISQFGIDRVAREPNFHHPPLILGGV